jgi:septal ring factor EnvC (AmiA/AmiB activator)
MQKHSTLMTIALSLFLGSSVAVVGCSSSPDEEELRQLNDLKEEYATLQKESAAKEEEKANLEKQIADKNAQLKKCNDDQQIVKQRLAK